MNTTHASLFTVTGCLFLFMPALSPGDFTKLGPDGSCASALWLGIMGFALCSIGLSWLTSEGVQRMRAAIENFDPVLPRLDATQVRWSMPASLYAIMAWEKKGLRMAV